MWLPEKNYIPTNRYAQLTKTIKEETQFTLYLKKWEEIDFNNPIGSGKEIEWELIDCYVQEKTSDKWAKYFKYGFVFSDDNGFFNLSIFEREMFTMINRLITATEFKLRLSVFEVSSTDGKKVYKNFGIWDNWIKLEGKLSKDELKELVKQTTNAVGKVDRDFSLREKVLRDMFGELKNILIFKREWISVEDKEVEQSIWEKLREKAKKEDNDNLLF